MRKCTYLVLAAHLDEEPIVKFRNDRIVVRVDSEVYWAHANSVDIALQLNLPVSGDERNILIKGIDAGVYEFASDELKKFIKLKADNESGIVN